LALVQGAKALALLRGRGHALPEDVRDLFKDALGHRLVLSYQALAEGVGAEALLDRVLEALPPPSCPFTTPMETPEALLRRLELKVVRPLDGLLFGDYRGVFYGRSLELAEISPFSPGDEAERIDWPATARTGELHVRRFREERELTLWLLLDGSPSMRFGSQRRDKYALALELALVFARIALRHGNRVGALLPGGLLPPRGGRAQALLLAQEGLKPRKGAPLGKLLDRLGRVARRRSLVFLLSDFLDPFYTLFCCILRP
jgi:uncharacterized protein (DUF58 family)